MTPEEFNAIFCGPVPPMNTTVCWPGPQDDPDVFLIVIRHPSGTPAYQLAHKYAKGMVDTSPPELKKWATRAVDYLMRKSAEARSKMNDALADAYMRDVESNWHSFQACMQRELLRFSRARVGIKHSVGEITTIEPKGPPANDPDIKTTISVQ